MSRRDVRTGSARRVDDGSTRSVRGSKLTAWSHQLDHPTLVDRVVGLAAVGLLMVQPGGLALVPPLLLALVRPRVPYLVSAAAATFAWVLLLSPSSDVLFALPGPNGLAVVVAVVIAMAASAAAFARAVEQPLERSREWWIPVAVLGAASAIAWFAVVTTMLGLGGGTFAPAILQLGVRQTPGLVVWPLAMGAVLAVQPRRVAWWTLPGAATLVMLALWAATGGFRLFGRAPDDLVIRGQTDSLNAAVEPHIVFQAQHPADSRFRPSAVRLAPVGRSYALGSLLSARRGTVYEWRVFQEGDPLPFNVEACDVAFRTAGRVLALVPRIDEIGHVGFELIEVTRESSTRLGIELPLVSRPHLGFDYSTHRWSVDGAEPPLRGTLAARLGDGFVLRMFDGVMRVRVTPRTVFEGFERLEDLTDTDRLIVEPVGPAARDEAARVVRVDAFQTRPAAPEKSVLIRWSGRLGDAGATTTRWTVVARGTVEWTPLDDRVALAQVMVHTGDTDVLDDPSRWADDGRHRPRFQLLEVTRRGQRQIADFGLAVVCRAPGAGDGTAVCTASNDRTLFVWRIAIERDQVDLEPLLSLSTPFMSPEVVTTEASVLTGPQATPIAVDHATGRAAPLALPDPVMVQSMVAVGPRELGALMWADGRTGVVRLRLPAAW